MKKRWIALLTAVCLVVAPMSVLAEETDYSYLEDMSVKELKELRDAINEILGDGAIEKGSVSDGYGTVSGMVTYYFNEYKGNVADMDSAVILLPVNMGVLDIHTEDIYLPMIESFDLGDNVYTANVNAAGEYMINHVPEGEYCVWIISGNTNTEEACMALIGEDGELESYYDSIASTVTEYLDKEDAYNIAEAALINSHYFSTITVYPNETTTVDHDFGMTYH